MAGLAIGKGGPQPRRPGSAVSSLPPLAPGPFLRRSTYISHNGIAWSSAEGAFRGHPRRCAEICRSTSYTYLNLCLSLEEPKCLHADDGQGDQNRKIVLILAHKRRFSSSLGGI